MILLNIQKVLQAKLSPRIWEVFLGSYDPPTLGHFSIVQTERKNTLERSASPMSFHRTIVCCQSEEKKNYAWFDNFEKTMLWRFFGLSFQFTILEWDKYLQIKPDKELIHPVRGIRVPKKTDKAWVQLYQGIWIPYNVIKEERVQLGLSKEFISSFTVLHQPDELLQKCSSSLVKYLIANNRIDEVSQFVPTKMIPILRKRYLELPTWLQDRAKYDCRFGTQSELSF
jgi:phosphopantetheine adenylyltransferase